MKQNEVLLINRDTDKGLTDMVSALQGAGLHVTCVADGQQGLSSLSERYPDLVILVEHLPGTDVGELCSRLRKASHLAIIVMGNSQERSHAAQVLEAGADAYLSKPPDPAELMAQVRSLMRRTKGAEQNSEALYLRKTC